MNVLEAIKTRRSIRKYTGKLIDDKDLELILKAGFQAPSAKNLQPREYIVIKDQNSLELITEFHQYAKMGPSAGCGIVVCGDKSKQESMRLLVADCSASIQNMLLAAHGLGLGAVWCGIAREELADKFSKLLDLPEEITPIGMVVIGEGDQKTATIDRYNPQHIHYDKYKRS